MRADGAPLAATGRALRECRVLVLDADDRRRALVERVMSGACRAVEARTELDAVPDDGDFDLVLLGHDTPDPPRNTEALERLAAHARTKLLVLSACGWKREPERLFRGRAINLLARSDDIGAEELLLTASKLVTRRIFGMEKHFHPGAATTTINVAQSSEKERVVEVAVSLARQQGVNGRLASLFETVIDELFTNAFYNSPVDASGVHIYAGRHRGEVVELPAAQAVEVKLCSDEQRIGVSVTDPFGSLEPNVILGYLAKCYRRGPGQVDDKPGGAGLGLYQAFESASHLAYNIQRGKRCEAIGLISVSDSYKDFVKKGRSLTILLDDCD